uniref:RING-type domain-containing protein n=1 Tax=Panagrellus redivivus TaxID=6233 RepID=A0A7E4ZRI9_PANRE
MNFADSYWPPHSPPKPQPSRASMEDMSECCICMETYTKEIRAPVTIPCGHTFCKSCINKFIKAKVIQCCVCNVVTIGFTKFSKNYAMLQMLEKLNLLTDEDDLKRPKSAESYNASDIPEKIYGNIGEKQFNQYSQFYLGFMKNYLNSNLGKTNQSTKKIDLQNAINKTDQAISAVKRCFEKPKSLYHNPPDPFFHLARTSNMLPPDLLTINDSDLLFHQNGQEDDDDVIFLQSTNSIRPTRRKRPRTTANRNSNLAQIPPLAPLVATPPSQPAPVQNDLNTEIAIFDSMLENIDRPAYQQVRDAINNNMGNLNRPNFDSNFNPYNFPPAPVSLPGQLFTSYNYGQPSSSQASQSQPNMFLSSQPQNPFNFPMGSYDQSGSSNNTPFEYQQPTSSAFNFSLDNKPITSVSAGAVDPFAAPVDQFNNTMNPLTQLRQQFARNQRTVLSRFPYSRAH